MTESAPPEWRCSICYGLLYEPVATPCRHHFCRECITKALAQTTSTCPLCKVRIMTWARKAPPVNEQLALKIVEALPRTAAYREKRRRQGCAPNDIDGDDAPHVEFEMAPRAPVSSDTGLRAEAMACEAEAERRRQKEEALSQPILEEMRLEKKRVQQQRAEADRLSQKLVQKMQQDDGVGVVLSRKRKTSPRLTIEGDTKRVRAVATEEVMKSPCGGGEKEGWSARGMEEIDEEERVHLAEGVAGDGTEEEQEADMETLVFSDPGMYDEVEQRRRTEVELEQQNAEEDSEGASDSDEGIDEEEEDFRRAQTGLPSPLVTATVTTTTTTTTTTTSATTSLADVAPRLVAVPPEHEEEEEDQQQQEQVIRQRRWNEANATDKDTTATSTPTPSAPAAVSEDERVARELQADYDQEYAKERARQEAADHAFALKLQASLGGH